MKNEILASREQFYVPVSLDKHYIGCFDDRGLAEAEASDPNITAITPDVFIRLPGGGLNIPYNFAVVGEAERPGGVTGTFATFARHFTPALIRARVKLAVHSDTTAEQGNTFKLETPDDVGCGYAALRQIISNRIGENGYETVDKAVKLRPELFDRSIYYDFAQDLTAAHGRLASRDNFFPGGRQVVTASATEGAKVMLVKGDHTAEEGIFNLVPDSSIHGDEAIGAGLPVYNQDSWAAEIAKARIQAIFPHDPRKQQIADLIDGVGTMDVLGVKEIAVRR